MKKLSKDQTAKREELVKKLRTAQEEVDKAVSAVNALIEDQLAKAVGSFNEAVGEVEDFKDELAGEMQNYFDERSEKWQEGEAGEAYNGWKDEWENLDCAEMDGVETISIDTHDLPDNLEGLADAPE